MMQHEFDAYFKQTGRIEPRDSTMKEQMRAAFRAGARAAKLGDALATAEENRACAALVKEAGCLCWAIRDWDDATQLLIEDVYDNTGIVVGEEVVTHDRRCPAALVAQIEARHG